MTASAPTAAKLLTNLRRAGVILAANGDRLAFDAPAGAMTPAVQAMLKARKPELLALLRGDYLNAAAALVLTISDSDQRAELAYLFDERAGICQYDGGMSRGGEAERIAYCELARAVDAQYAADGIEPVERAIFACESGDRRCAMTPTARTLKLLRDKGWTCQTVESWIPRLNIRRDLFGVGDVLAMKICEPLLLVQATSAANVSARIGKAKKEPRLRTWLVCGHRFEVWGWGKRNQRWERRRNSLIHSDLAGVTAIAPPRRKRKPVEPSLFR